MRCAIAFHPEHVQRTASRRLRLMVTPMLIPEDRLAAARGQGWIVLATDSEMEPPAIDANVQSNPIRHPERLTDHGEQ